MHRPGRITRAASRTRATGIAIAAVLLVGAFGAPSASATVGQQEDEVKRVVAELEREHEHIDQLVEQYVQALDQKAGLDVEIAASLAKIASQEGELGLVQQHLGNVAVQKYIEGDSGGLGPLFTDPADIGEGLQKEQLTRVALNAGSATTDDFEQLIKDFNAEKLKLEQAQAQVIQIAAAAEAKRAEAEAATIALESRLVQEKTKLGDLIEQEQQRQINAAAAQYKQEVAARQAQLAAAAAANNSGGGSGNSGGNSSTGSGNAGNAGSGGGDAGSGDTGAGSSGGDTGANNPPPVSGRAGVAVNAALEQKGVAYRYAASSPGVAFDCSGLTSYAWGQAGVGLPHQSGQQYASVPHVDKTDAQPGDLIFYYSPISHVGIYLGSGSLVHAPATGDVVKVSAVNWAKVVGVGRPG
jgi:peptidoglycan DL-endopeptidase CwlO